MDWGGKGVIGFGFDRDALEEAGIAGADALAAVTNGDNSNILTARIAKETYQVPNVVARIYDPRRAVIYRRLGIPTVATVTWTVDQVMRRLLPERTVTEWSSPSGEVVIVERSVPGSWVGYRLDELESPGRIRIVALSRAGKSADPQARADRAGGRRPAHRRGSRPPSTSWRTGSRGARADEGLHRRRRQRRYLPGRRPAPGRARSTAHGDRPGSGPARGRAWASSGW